MCDSSVQVVQLVDALDEIEVRGPQNQVLVIVKVSKETGKYVVDDHASGRLHGGDAPTS